MGAIVIVMLGIRIDLCFLLLLLVVVLGNHFAIMFALCDGGA